MSEQLYRVLSMTGSRTKFSDGRIHAREVMLEPVDPTPVNPWIKGSERMPSREDVTSDGGVFYWDDVAKEAFVCNWGQIEPHNYWRKVDQTPPPAEPTDYVRELIKIAKDRPECIGTVRELALAAERQLEDQEGRGV